MKKTRQTAWLGKDPIPGPSGKQRKQFPTFWVKYGGPKPDHQRGLLYHVKKIREAVKLRRPIFLLEGEGKADLMRKWEFDATCGDGGALYWNMDHAEELYGATVIIMPDNDQRGRAHSDKVGLTLINGFAKSVHILEMPPEYGDVKNWIEDGHTKEQFEELLKTNLRDWKPYGPLPKPKELIQSIEIRPGEVELFNVLTEGGTVIVDAEALNYFPWFNRAAIAQIRRSFPQYTNKPAFTG